MDFTIFYPLVKSMISTLILFLTFLSYSKVFLGLQEINRIEIGRLDRERHDDLVNMLKGFMISQVTLCHTSKWH